jgi:predicted TIM-barrel fold metal-dependent hydrolase
MIIDVHTHCAYHKLYPHGFMKSIIASIYSSGQLDDVPERLVTNIYKSNMCDIDSAKLLKQMDEAGIDKSILLIADLGYGKGEAELSIEEIYEHYRKIKDENNDRFIVFAGIDPRRGESGYLLFKKGIENFDFRGLKLYPPCGYEINSPLLYDYYDLCSKYRLPVLIHTGVYVPPFDYRPEHYPESVAEIAGRYKDVAFILGHGGIKDYLTGIQLSRTTENIYVDISAFQSEINDLELVKEKMKMLSETVPEKILFGTDWPMFLLSGSQKKWVDFICELNVFSDNDLDKLFFKNINSILNF